ncbi:hypothetical protein [Ruegeria denitrificans]|uniref:hypothetical protein n=1 Tax=Ruegeria denitrificans TaxID=1715692 RepID=UPI00103EEB46|nr:hypothetical protein [Ruegeria denitrificans]
MDVEANRIGWERAEKIFSSVFSLIQAGIVLGLLKAGMHESASILLFALLAVCWVSTGVYILRGANYLLALLFEHLKSHADKPLAKIGFVAVTTSISLGVPYVVSALTSDIVLKVLS